MIYDFIKVGGDALRLLWRNVCQKISAQVDGELKGGSRMRSPGSEDPHLREWKCLPLIIDLCRMTEAVCERAQNEDILRDLLPANYEYKVVSLK